MRHCAPNDQASSAHTSCDQRFPFAEPAPAIGTVSVGTAVLTAREDKITRTSKAYARISLRNATGGATLNVWAEKLPLLDGLTVGAPVRVTCTRVTGRDGTNEWQFDAIEPLDPQHPVRREAMPICPVPRATLIARTTQLLDAMSVEAREVFARVMQTKVRWSDGALAPIKAAYLEAPAAMGHHHNHLGGLWWHSLQVAEGAVALATAYAANDAQDLDLDAVRLGGLLHDVGKVDEYGWDGVIAMAPLSGSMSHMGHGIRRITEAVLRAELADGWIPSPRQRDLIEHVQHIVASHHMQREWGAISEPSSREAWYVQSADLVSSRVQPITDATASMQDRGDGWVSIKDGWRTKFVYVSPTERPADVVPDAAEFDAVAVTTPLLTLHVPFDLPNTEA